MNELLEKEIKPPVVFDVNNADDLSRATACLKGIKVLQEKAKAKHDPVVEHWHKAHKDAISDRDKDLKPLQDLEKKFKSAILVYTQRMESEQRERERQANEMLAKIAEENKQKLLKEAKESTNEWESEIIKDKAESIVPVTVVVATKVVEQAGLSIRRTWKARILNLSLIPKEYWLVNESLLNAHAKDENIRKTGIGGVEFYQEESASVRS